MYNGPQEVSGIVNRTSDINFAIGISRNDNTNVGKLIFQQFRFFLTECLKCVWIKLQRVQSTKYRSRPDKNRPSGAPRHLAGAFKTTTTTKNDLFPSRPSGWVLPCRVLFFSQKKRLRCCACLAGLACLLACFGSQGQPRDPKGNQGFTYTYT